MQKLLEQEEIEFFLKKLGVDIPSTDYAAILDFLLKKFGVFVSVYIDTHRNGYSGPWTYSVIDYNINSVVDEEMRAWFTYKEALLNGLGEGIAYVMSQIDSGIIVTIDGYPASGKSTMAKRLAKEINYVYIDSGAMYRSIALYYMQHPDLLVNSETLERISISFRKDLNGDQITQLNGVDVEKEIRKLEVGNYASDLGVVDCVQKYVMELQRHLGKLGGVVIDGRDTGTVVFPNAQLKLFVTADLALRAERRSKELHTENLDVVVNDLKNRDYQDIDQFVGEKSRKPIDAYYLDTTALDEDGQFEFIKRLYDRAIKAYWSQKPDLDLSKLIK